MSLSARGVAAMCGGGSGGSDGGAAGADPTATPVVDVAMPASVSDEIATVASGVKTLDRVIEDRKGKLPGEFVAGWRDFRAEWDAFAQNHDSWLSRTWYKSYQKTLEYRRRLEDWRGQLERLSSPVDAPNLGPGQAPAGIPSGIPWKPIGYGLLAIAGLYAGARLLSSGAELKREFHPRQIGAA